VSVGIRYDRHSGQQVLEGAKDLYPVIRHTLARLICYTVAVSLSLTSVAGASMMAKMGFDTGLMQAVSSPCEHQAADSGSATASNSSPSGESPSMADMHGLDSSLSRHRSVLGFP